MTGLELLRDRFGDDGFRPGQERGIETLLAGRPAPAVFSTGGGKSLGYPRLCGALEGRRFAAVLAWVEGLTRTGADSLPGTGLQSTS